jgi:hypothetical protein
VCPQWRRSRTPHPQLLQRIDAAGLQQLAHDPVRLLQALLQQDDAAALLAKRNRRGASHDAGAHDDHVGFVVLQPPLLARVGLM